MRHLLRAGLSAALLLAALAGTPPALAADDQAEIALWQAVTARGLKSDYEGYLLLFPQGRFAALARLRADGTGPAQPPAPPPGINLYSLEVTPPVAARGQAVTVRCRGFLPAALFDLVVVVRAGTPDPGPGNPDEKAFAAKALAHLYDMERAGVPLPALPPGAYEVRYLSRQYNPDGRMEVMARAGLTVQ